MTKDDLLKTINQRITLVSNLNPPPVGHIAGLQDFKRMVEIATPLEIIGLEGKWQKITATYKNT